jgi:hypothetical protein
MKKILSIILSTSIAWITGAAPASSLPNPVDGWGVSANIGTLGIGVNLDRSFSSNIGGRLGASFGSIGADRTESGIDYNATLNFNSFQLLGDFYPFGSGLRLTGGLMYQNNRFSVNSKPTNNAYTINGTQYSSAEVGGLQGEFQYANAIAPYVGIGYGKGSSDGFGFNADLGVLFTGAPKVNLNATNPVFNNNATTRSQIDAQARQTENDLQGFNLYPVLSVGVSYSF